MADTGWVLPDTATSVDDVPGYTPYTFPWADPENVCDDGYPSAECFVPEGWGTSSELLVCEFSPTIPSGSAIDGVEVKFRRVGGISGDGGATDNIVRLAGAGGAFGDNKADTETIWEAYAEITYGGAADTWGAAISLALARQLRIHLAAVVVSPEGFANSAVVDHVKVRVHYTEGAGAAGTLASSGGVVG